MIRKSLLSILAAGIVCSLAAAPASAQSPPQKSIVCVGSEDLPGYGPLSFRFFDGSRVDMTDKDGTTTGTWRIVEDELVLSFYGNTVEYRGAVQGNRLAGRATNGRVTWNWSVQLPERDPAQGQEYATPPPGKAY
ncbi:MAG: hypothetical protein L0Y71_25940 [Gemmataceae bacterium]|nr:hypothetical protein [Gemmataceae bacterium]